MSPLRNSTITFALLVGLHIGLVAHAQDDATLPANWRSLSVVELAEAMDGIYKSYDDEFLIELDESELRKQAATLYSQIDLANTTLDLQTVDVIHGLAFPELDEATKERDLETLTAQQVDWAEKTYEEARARYTLLDRLRLSEEECNAVIKAWADAGGDLDTIWTDDLPNMREVVSGWKTLKESSTITWTGTITAPTSGSYTFSIPNLQLTARAYKHHERYDLKHSTSIKINGVQILNSTPKEFQYQATPVQLTAGQAVPVEMISTFETPNMPKRSVGTALYWSGPGLKKTVVAPRYFQKLQINYQWEEDGERQTYTQSATSIDNAWPDRVSFGTDQTYQTQIADVMWERVMTPEYLSRCEKKGERHPFLAHAEDTVEMMTAARCTTFLNEALARPALLQGLDPKTMFDVYRSFRLKDPEKALDLFGVWATLNSDCPCRLPLQYTNRMKHFKEFFMFDYYNQRTWRTMAQCVTVQSPTHAQRLEEEYLELEDGSCSLPVAQVLNYVYMGQGKHKEWIKKLAAKTNDESLSGDLKANWYIAATQAHETRLGPHNDIFAIINPRPMDGIQYLDTAILEASSPEVKLRLLRSKAARYSAVREFEKSRETLQQAARIAPADHMKEVESCQDCITRFEQSEQTREANQADEAKQAYLETLRKRLEKATTRGDDVAIQRYNNMIQKAEAE